MKSWSKRFRWFMITLFTCIACVCLVFGVTACSSGTSGAIGLDEYTVTIAEGETHTITATATDTDGGAYTGNYVWTHDGDAIDITTNGNICIITGISAGYASVTVTAGSFSATCSVTVKAKDTPTGTTTVESVSLSQSEMTLYEGGSGTLTASLEISGGTVYTGEYDWSSSDEAVIKVTSGDNGSCIIGAVGVGSATVTVTVGDDGKEASCVVTVKEDKIDSLELSASTLKIAVGEERIITVSVKMASGLESAEFTVTSSDANVATITTSGNEITVKGVAEGTITITVTAGTLTATCNVIVGETEAEDYIDRVYVDFSDPSTYSWIDSEITSGVTYSDPSGILTLYAGGGTAVDGDHLNTGGGSSSSNKRYFEINLSSYVGYVLSVEVVMTSNSGEARSVCLDTQYASAGSVESKTTLAYATSSSATDKETLQYMAEITENTTILYLTCDKSVNYYIIDIQILDPSAVTPEVKGVSLSESVLVLKAGETGNLTAKVEMNIGEYEGEYEWISSDGGVVTVSGTSAEPEIKAIGAGTATITVKIGDFTAECFVVVSDENGDDEYEWITSEFDYEKALTDNGASASTADYTQGIFTIGTGVNYEAEDFNTQKADITIKLSGITNTISFTAKGGSGSGNSVVGIYLVEDNGTRKDVTPDDWPGDGVKQNETYDFVASGITAGTYVITTSYTARIYGLKVEQFVAVSDPCGISATAGNVDFLKGRNVTVDDLKLNIMLDYENGRQDPLDASEVEIALNSSNLEVGRNEITITYHYTYKDEGGSDTTKDFSTSVYIYVYSVDEITISDFSMEYTGGIYYTNNVQKVFLVGDSINYDYAAVTAYATCSYTDEEGESHTLTKEFVMTSADGLTFSNNANPSNAGKYQVTATANMGQTEGNAKTASYDIHVVEVTSSTDITSVKVIAPTEEEGEENATYEAGEDGIISVATINDAIKLIKLMGATDKERKFIYVGAGVYNEKVYIDIPNLSLIGSNPSENETLATKSEVTEIVYDAMNGVMDPSGTTTYSTVGSATVTVASQATDFYAANITFRNYWNTNALYNEARTITSDTQADAAYINADRAHFYNVTFTGYHDTLEAENGRQYYDHCYIEGRTDYIFGNTATCYFKDCTIHTIGAGSSTNGGYVTAVKGGSMTYGYVFDGCNFTSDLKTYYTEGGGDLEVPYDDFAYTEEGTVSLGRTWSSSNMHVAVINSELDAGYSTTAYGTSGKNPRYTDMSGYAPNENYLVEYNNTGEGAISASLSGTCSLLTEEEAATYTIENIFAEVNGEVTYDSDWDPSSVALITITVKNTSGNDVATIYAKDSMSVSDLVDAINARLSDTQVAAIYKDSTLTEEITEDVVAGEGNSVTVYIKTEEKDMSITKSTYWDFYNENFGTETTTSGYLDDEEKLYLDVSEGGSFERYNGKYYYMKNATITLTIKAGAILCIGVYQENSVSVTDEAGNILTLETLSTGNDKTAYTYTAAQEVALSIAPGEQALYFMYMNVSVGPIDDDTTITFRDKTQNSMEYNGCCGWYYDICIDATAGKFQVRSSGDAIVNEGTILYVRSKENATATINWYTGYEGKEEGNITVDENGYIKIVIELPDNPANGGSRYIWDIVVTVQA